MIVNSVGYYCSFVFGFGCGDCALRTVWIAGLVVCLVVVVCGLLLLLRCGVLVL